MPPCPPAPAQRHFAFTPSSNLLKEVSIAAALAAGQSIEVEASLLIMQAFKCGTLRGQATGMSHMPQPGLAPSAGPARAAGASHLASGFVSHNVLGLVIRPSFQLNCLSYIFAMVQKAVRMNFDFRLGNLNLKLD